MARITEQELAEIEERIESAHAYESFISPERVEDLVAEVRRLRGLLVVAVDSGPNPEGDYCDECDRPLPGHRSGCAWTEAEAEVAATGEERKG